MNELRKRKPNRLKEYDYSQNGMYFVTICTKNREELFGHIVGAVDNRPSYAELTDLGQIIINEINIMQNIRKNVLIDHYVIMPNHIHMIIVIAIDDGWPADSGRLTTAPTLSEIIRLWKRAISKQIGFSPWQKSYHDHIIRNEHDYNQIAEYIRNNPANWENDRFYVGGEPQ
jgi:REP element-mobilizing transposase RayT